MANELEALEKRQLSAQRSLNDLTNQLTLADHLVYKKYLAELQNYGMVTLSQEMLNVQNAADCIRMYQLKELTLKKGGDMFQKLSTVYYSSMAQGCSLAVMIDVPEENVGANIYLGIREDPSKKNMKSHNLDTSSKTLQKVLRSNFPGSETRGISLQEEEELLDGAFGDAQEAVASVSCVAALRDKSKTEDKAFVQGITLGDGLECLPAKLEILKSDAQSEALITIHEGKFHQIKRMLASRGKPVVYLKRLSMGSLTLDEGLSKGEYRLLTAEEIKNLRESGQFAQGKAGADK